MTVVNQKSRALSKGGSYQGPGIFAKWQHGSTRTISSDFSGDPERNSDFYVKIADFQLLASNNFGF